MTDHVQLIASATRSFAEHQTWVDERDVMLGNFQGVVIVQNAIYPRSVYWHNLPGEIHEQGIAVLSSDSNVLYQENAVYASNPPRITIGRPPRSDTNGPLFVKGRSTSLESIRNEGNVSQREQYENRLGNPHIYNVFDFRVRPTDTPSTSVYIEAGEYQQAAAPGIVQTWLGGVLDLSATISALTSGKHQMGLAYFNKSTGAPGVLTSTAVTAVNTVGTAAARAELTATTLASITALSAAQKPCGVIYLYNGQTTLAQADMYTTLDPRFSEWSDVMVGSNGSVAGTRGLVPAPAAADQFKWLRGDGGWFFLATTDIPGLDVSKITSGLQGMCQGRLTLSSGTAVPTSDVTAATTLYFTPYKGNLIALFDGSSKWNLYNFSEKSIAVPATSNTVYDVFIYDNAGVPTLETLAWNLPLSYTIAAANGITNASPRVLTTTATHAITTGQLITVSGNSVSANNATWRAGTVTGTTITLLNLDGTNSSAPGSVGNNGTVQLRDGQETRATALALQDGIYVKTGATTRRYLGTIRTTPTSGQCEDSITNRLVYNYYNRVNRRTITGGSASHTVTVALRAFNNDLSIRHYIVTGVVEEHAISGSGGNITPGSAGTNYITLGQNSNSVATNFEVINGGSAGFQVLNASSFAIAGVGCNWLQLLEASSTSTTFTGYHFYFIVPM